MISQYLHVGDCTIGCARSVNETHRQRDGHRHEPRRINSHSQRDTEPDRQTELNTDRETELETDKDRGEREVLRGDPGDTAGVFGVAHHTAGLRVEFSIGTVWSVLV